MEVTVLLANAASVDVAGGVDVLGLGWEITGPSPLNPFVVFIQVKAPRDWGDEAVSVQAQLLDEHGEQVHRGEADAGHPMEVSGLLEVPPQAGRPEGISGGGNFLLEVASGLILDPGIYEWVVFVQGETRPHWRRRFYVRAKEDEFPARGLPRQAS